MVLLGGGEIWTTCWTDPAPVTFHWQESPFTTNKHLPPSCYVFFQIFFPSVVICNTNSLRGSFIHELAQDPVLGTRLGHDRLWYLVNDAAVMGKDMTSQDELDMELIINSTVYSQIYAEFMADMGRAHDIIANTGLVKYHGSLELSPEEKSSYASKKAYLIELSLIHI